MTEVALNHADSPKSRSARLATRLRDKKFRHAYLVHHLKSFLANQIRELRGDQSQKAFGEQIGKPQSVVSRLENEAYGQVSLQTLIDIATRLDVALMVRFVTFQEFLRGTRDFSEKALAPESYSQESIDALARHDEADVELSMWRGMFAPTLQAIPVKESRRTSALMVAITGEPHLAGRSIYGTARKETVPLVPLGPIQKITERVSA